MAKTKTTKTTKKKSASKSKAKASEVSIDRRTSVKKERRSDSDRRQKVEAIQNERRKGPERRKVARRRQIDPTTCERDYNGDEIEFMHALDAYKRAAGRMFPTCSEVLEVLRDLGYRRLTPEELEKLRPEESITTVGSTELDSVESESELLEESLDDFES